jgi:hypothetical protein
MSNEVSGLEARLRELQLKLARTLSRLAANEDGVLPESHARAAHEAATILLNNLDTAPFLDFCSGAGWRWLSAATIEVFTLNRSKDTVTGQLVIREETEARDILYTITPGGKVVVEIGALDTKGIVHE